MRVKARRGSLKPNLLHDAQEGRAFALDLTKQHPQNNDHYEHGQKLPRREKIHTGSNYEDEKIHIGSNYEERA